MDLSHLASLAPPAETGFEGKWHVIEFQPDPGVPQRFNIGVALSMGGKLVGARVAQDAARLRCFYGKRFTGATWEWLRNELQAELQAARNTSVLKFECSSPQISITEGMYTSGPDSAAALSRAFERAVTVIGEHRPPRAHGIAQKEAREAVAGILKKRMSTRFDPIHHPNGLLIRDEGTAHAFDITYDDAHVASTVVSACYAQPETGQLNVTQALSELYTFHRIRKREQVGLAVLLPSAELLPRESVRAWAGWWAELSYKLRESSLVLLAEATSPDQLADQVGDWYPEGT